MEMEGWRGDGPEGVKILWVACRMTTCFVPLYQILGDAKCPSAPGIVGVGSAGSCDSRVMWGARGTTETSDGGDEEGGRWLSMVSYGRGSKLFFRPSARTSFLIYFSIMVAVSLPVSAGRMIQLEGGWRSKHNNCSLSLERESREPLQLCLSIIPKYFTSAMILYSIY